MKKVCKSFFAILMVIFLLLTFSLFLVGASPDTRNVTETIVDELEDWSKVSGKSDGWQIDKTVPALGAVINKNGNNDIQYLIYKVSGIQNIRIYGYQLDSLSDVARDIKAYVSDNGSEWTQLTLTASEPVATTVERWSCVTLSADNIPDAPDYLKVEMQELEDPGNIWVTSIAKVEIDLADNTPTSPKPTTDLSDELDDWSKVYTKSDGWQLDGTMPELGGMVNKAGNNETQYLIYALKGVRTVRIDVALLSSSPELVDFVRAYVSEDQEIWREIPLKKGMVSASGREGWSICMLSADGVGNTSETQYLKIEILPLTYANGADALANCYGIGLTRVEVNKAVPTPSDPTRPEDNEPVQPGTTEPTRPSPTEPAKPSKPELSDELDNFDLVYEKSDGWQLDSSDKNLGGVINKMGNNDVQYIIYKLDDIRNFVIYACQFTSMSDVTRDIKAYVSADNKNWEEASLIVGDSRFSGNWKIIALSADGLSGANYLKVELGELAIDDNLANCFVTGIAKVEINVPENSGDEDTGAESIHDDLADWSKVFDKSGGWQLDASDKSLGTVINKMGNNDVQYITYKLNNIGSFSFTACSFSSFSDVKKDFKVYVSADNKTWKEVAVTAVKGKTTGSWTMYTLSAENIADGMNYLKIELQALEIDETANCFVTGIDRVDVYSSKKLGSNPATGEVPAVFGLLPLTASAAVAAAMTWKKRNSRADG